MSEQNGAENQRKPHEHSTYQESKETSYERARSLGFDRDTARKRSEKAARLTHDTIQKRG